MGDFDIAEEPDLPDEVVSNLDKSFEEAVSYFGVQAAGGKVSTDDMLTMYGFYKQATEGPCSKPRPGIFDRTGRAKWSAWKKLEDMAGESARLSYVKLLVKLNPEFLQSLTQSLQGGGKATGPMGPVFSSLAELGADGASAQEDALAAGSLHMLASEGELEGLEGAFRAGADANARDSEGCTPLHWAADRGNLQAIALLLEGGAEVDARDNDGLTPLHYAALCEQEEAGKGIA
eukprot:jgi/Botrbrau1/17963/Bobra.50_1s0055.1